MGLHPSGDGVAWDSLEVVDVDQPHGLDYQYAQHLSKAVRKRISKEHEAFGDTTAGGEHSPGKCGVCLVCDDTADFTAFVDATTAPLGCFAYCISHANLWCMTGTASGGSPDVTVIKLGPQSFCLGADYTLTGALEIDGSIDFSSPTWFDDSVDIQGLLACASSLAVDGSADFSDVQIAGDISIAGTLKVATDFTLTGDMAVDGTSNFNDEADFSSVNASGVIAVLSAYTNKDSEENAMLKSHAYKAATDGEVSATVLSLNKNEYIRAFVGTTDDPAGAGTLIDRHEGISDVEGANHGVHALVAKDEYFEILCSNTPTILWKSFGVLSKPVDQD